MRKSAETHQLWLHFTSPLSSWKNQLKSKNCSVAQTHKTPHLLVMLVDVGLYHGVSALL